MLFGENDVNINNCVASQKNTQCLLTALALISSIQFANAATVLPANVKSTCVFSAAEFNGIFESGSVAKNGGVLPADSFAFNPNSLCSFYKWSEQMFLWLTSPVPSRYGSGSHVFDSPAFYAVSPLDSNNQRTLIPHTPGRLLPFLPVISQRGSRGQEVVFDSAGKIHNVIRPAVGPNGKLLVRDKAGQPVEIEQILALRDGKPVLLDRTKKQVEVQTTRSGAPILHDELGAAINLRASTALVNGIPHLVTTSGAVIQAEEGQAGGGGLIAQNGSLVFYLIQVNDVYAYFNTGIKDNKITSPTPSTFPTTGGALGQITTFAQQAPAPFTKPFFPDNVAMAVEVKSSWIETTGLANVGDYVTINATVPTYNPPLTQANNTLSVQSGTKQTQLALVGIHVVGSTLDHPEMLWATFEHVNNTPNPQYTFTTTGNTLGTQPADGPGGWVFSSTGAAGGTNNQRIAPSGTSITAVSGQTIGPSDVVRVNPWGTAATDSAFTKNNTDIISINKNVIGMLAAGDVRKNYILTGTTWVLGGGPPSTGVVTGTTNMSNSTMETFFQGSNCFDCHSDATGNMLGTSPGSDGFSGGLSHIWAPILPLFP
jgi:hypothetical protein